MVEGAISVGKHQQQKAICSYDADPLTQCFYRIGAVLEHVSRYKDFILSRRNAIEISGFEQVLMPGFSPRQEPIVLSFLQGAFPQSRRLKITAVEAFQ